MTKVDLRYPETWDGKMLMAHYLSQRKEDQSPREDRDKMVCCSEVVYNEDLTAYTLERPHYVRLGLSWPFVGAEIGCWLRRHHLVEHSLGHRKD